MKIFKCKRRDNRMVINKDAALDERLSLTAKGLIFLAFSMPQEIAFIAENIKQFCNSSHELIFEGVLELTKYGYIRSNENGDSVIHDVVDHEHQSHDT